MRTVLASPVVEVVVERDPWRLGFLGPDLQQVEPLAFTTSGRWPPGPLPRPTTTPAREATGAWSGASWTRWWTTGSTEPRWPRTTGGAGRLRARGGVTVELVDDGTVSVSAEVEGAAVCRQTFFAEAGERFLGFGERSHAVSLERGVVEHYVGEGPYQPDEYQFLSGTVPPWGLRQRPDATYYPVPWVLSTRGYGRGDRARRGELHPVPHRGGRPLERRRRSGRLDYVVFAGPTPLDALARFTAHTGRQPEPERWWFGPWYQTGHANHVPLEEEIRQADVLRGAGAAVSAAETHCRYLPLGEDRGFEDSERARTQMFHDRGLAVLTYLNPLIGNEYPEAFLPAEGNGALLRRADGQTHLFQAYAGGRTPPHTDETHYDFTHPAAPPSLGARGGANARRRVRRMDGGLRRVHAARRGGVRRLHRNRAPQPLPDAVPRPRRTRRPWSWGPGGAGGWPASRGPAGRARRPPPRSSGAEIRRPRGVSTAWRAQ